MIYWLAGIYAGALLAWVAVVEVRKRRRKRRTLARWQKAIPRWEDPEAPTMSEARCQQLGHAWCSAADHPWKSCARCGAFEKADLKDFDVRRQRDA